MTNRVTCMLSRSFVIFYFETFWPNYDIDIRSYGQLLSLFYQGFREISNGKINDRHMVTIFVLSEIIFVVKCLEIKKKISNCNSFNV